MTIACNAMTTPLIVTDGAAPAKFSLADVERYDNEVLYLSYAPQ